MVIDLGHGDRPRRMDRWLSSPIGLGKADDFKFITGGVFSAPRFPLPSQNRLHRACCPIRKHQRLRQDHIG